MNDTTRIPELIQGLPKTELHLHIEGSLEPSMVLDLARRNGVDLPYKREEDLTSLYDFEDLQSFLDLYYQATAVLQTEQDFFDLTWAYLKRCEADNVVHTEIFFDPQSHTSRGIPFRVVIDGIDAALRQAETEMSISSRLIMCYLRHLSQEEALQTWDDAEPYLDKIHGVGLDSSERNFPPRLFKEVFALARDAGLKTVAHAGEEGPPDYIREALGLLQVSRIDHGVRITEDAELMDEVAQLQIPLTICPLSNTRLCVYEKMQDHPILSLLDRGLLVMINSDDPAYFGGYVNDNYHAVADALSATEEQIVQLAKNSFAAAFLDQGAKDRWMAKCDALYKRINTG
jgi:adenosine deaminase